MDKKTAAGHIAALITIMIWGTTFISTKLLLGDFTPIEILFFRFLLGLLALTIVYPKGLKVKDRKQELTFAAAGLCGICLYYLLENTALTCTMASKCRHHSFCCSVFYCCLISYLHENRRKTADTILCRLSRCHGRNMPDQP